MQNNDQIMNSPITVLVVDDNLPNRELINRALGECRLFAAQDLQSTFNVLRLHRHVDVIVLDVANGHELCEQIRESEHWRGIPIILLNAQRSVKSRIAAYKAGVDDFISKPFSTAELWARVQNSARSKRYKDQFESPENILFTLTSVVASKDLYTNGHLLRIGKMTEHFCQMLALSPPEQEMIRYGGVLHDIGKVGISDTILLKPEKLTPQEFEIIKTHPITGCNIVSSLQIGKQVGPIIRGHHERWDGSGYPDGLRGADIPLGARIIGICDVFDALMSDRPYRKAVAGSEALTYIQEHAGAQFDPELVPIFTEVAQTWVDP